MALDLSQMPQEPMIKESTLISEASKEKDLIAEGKDPPQKTDKDCSNEKTSALKELPQQSIPDIVKEAVQSENNQKEIQQAALASNGDISSSPAPMDTDQDQEKMMCTEAVDNEVQDETTTLPPETKLVEQDQSVEMGEELDSKESERDTSEKEDEVLLIEEERHDTPEGPTEGETPACNGDPLPNSIQGILEAPTTSSAPATEQEGEVISEPQDLTAALDKKNQDVGSNVESNGVDTNPVVQDKCEVSVQEYQPPQTEAMALTKSASSLKVASSPLTIELEDDDSDTTPTPILKIPSYSPQTSSYGDPQMPGLIHPSTTDPHASSLPHPAHSIRSNSSLTSPKQPPPAHSASAPKSLIRHATPGSVRQPTFPNSHQNRHQMRPRSAIHATGFRAPVQTTYGRSPPVPVGARKRVAAPAALGRAPSDSDKPCVDDNGNTVTLEMQTIQSKSKGPSHKGLKGSDDKPVGWTTLAGTIMPYIMRSNTKYVSVKMVESKLLAKYPNIDLDEMAEASPIYSYYVTETEAKLLTEINSRCYSHAFGSEPFSTKDLIVSLQDFEKFYKNIQIHFQKLEAEKAAAVAARSAKRTAHRRQLNQSSSGGWLQINNTVCPYVVRGGIKYVPISVIKYAARLLLEIDLSDHRLPTTEEEIMGLNMMCKNVGVSFTFDIKNTELLKVEMVVRLNKIRVSIKELPKKNPFDHGEFNEEFEVIKEANGLPRTMPPPPNGDSNQDLEATTKHKGPMEARKVQPVHRSQKTEPTLTVPRPPSLKNTPKLQQPPKLQQAPKLKSPPGQHIVQSQQGHTVVHRPPLQPPQNVPVIPVPQQPTSMPPENAALLQLKQMVNARAQTTSRASPVLSSPPNVTLNRLPPSGQPPLPPQAHPPPPPMQQVPPTSQPTFTPQPITIAPLDPNQIPGAPPDHDIRPPMSHHMTPPMGQFGYFSRSPFRPEHRPPPPPYSQAPSSLQRMHGPPPLRAASGHIQPRPLMDRTPPPYQAMAQGLRRPPVSYAMTRPPIGQQLTGMHVSHSQRPPVVQQQRHTSLQHQPSPKQQVPQALTKSMVQKPSPKSLVSNEPLIKPVRLSGKTVSCILRRKTGQRYALVEALARLYFPQCTLQEFQKVLRDDLSIPLEELSTTEEQEFIKFYDLPVKSLKCKTVAPISPFEAFFSHLKIIFKDKMSPKQQASPGSQRINRAPSSSSTGALSPGVAPSRSPNVSPLVVRDKLSASNSMSNLSDGSGSSVHNHGGSRSSTPSEASGPSKRPSSTDPVAPPAKKVKTLGNVLAKLKQRQEASLVPK